MTTLTKALHGESGVNQAASADYSAAYALGEDIAGTESRSTNYDFASGYFSGFASGYTGNFSLVSATVGASKIMQGGFQVGVPLSATVQLVFSNPLDPTTLAQGISPPIPRRRNCSMRWLSRSQVRSPRVYWSCVPFAFGADHFGQYTSSKPLSTSILLPIPPADTDLPRLPT